MILFIFILLETLSQEIGSFWIIADPHIDLYYQHGADPSNQNWGDLGCRIKSPHQTTYAGKYGTPFANCDIPLITFKEVLDFISTYPNDKSSSVMFLGDIPGHDVKNQTKEENLNVMTKAYDLLVEYFGKDCNKSESCEKLILPCLGNHDTFPIEQLCPASSLIFKECGKPVLDVYGDFASNFFPPEMVENIKSHGYYSFILPDTNLKFISLQTQWASVDNLWMWDSAFHKNPHFMTEWLQFELEKSKNDGDNVILFGHISVDADEPSPFQKLFPSWQSEFLDVIESYHEIIIASFFGHDHTDRFYLQKDSEGKSTILVNFVCPSVVTGTPNLHHGGGEYEENNPSVRLVKYDTKTSQIVDILTFVNDIQKSNVEGSMRENWRLEYSFLEDFGMRDLSKGEFDELFTRLNNDDSLFQKYFYFHHCGIYNRTCEGYQKTKQLCMIENSHVQKFDLCLNT